MTVIVYRDGILAADSQIVSRQWVTVASFIKIGRRDLSTTFAARTPSEVTKFKHVPGVYLYAATGETAFCQKFMDWCESSEFLTFVEHGTNWPNIEPVGKDESCSGLLFTPAGACIKIEGSYPPFQMNGPFYAFGSGEMVALGAMAAGADAKTAARIACEYDVLTNGPIQSIARFNPPGLTPRVEITR